MSIARSTALIGFGTIASRLLGFARDVLVARLFGAGPVADALLVALRLPNLFRRVLGEGGLNAGLVPAYARLKAQHGEAAAGRFAGAALANLALGLLLLVALCHMAAPWIVLVLSGGGFDGAAPPAGAAAYLRAALPFVAGATLASALAAWLAAERRFAAPAFAPLSVNAVLIAALVLVERTGFPAGRQALLFAAAWSFAGFVQLALTILLAGGLPVALRDLRPRWSPDLRRALTLGLPALAASGAAQVILLVAVAVAAQVPSWASWLYYADRLFALPIGFVAAATSVVLLAEVAERVSAAPDAAASMMDRAVLATLALALPAAIGQAMLAPWIVQVLFERGAFGPSDTLGTAAVLVGLSPGLVAASLGKALAQGFFAREALRVPILALALGLVVTAAGATLLAARLGPLGLGLGISAGLAAHALVLGGFALADAHWRPGRASAIALGKILLACAGMAATVRGLEAMLTPLLASQPAPGGWGMRAAALAIICLAGMAIYAALAFGLRLLARPSAWRAPPDAAD